MAKKTNEYNMIPKLQKFIGRDEEVQILETVQTSPDPEMLAVIGRRRVGKTFMIRSVFKGKMDFEMSGTHNGTLEENLEKFAEQLTEYSKSQFMLKAPETWTGAFRMLKTYLSNKKVKRKHIIFFDEVQFGFIIETI